MRKALVGSAWLALAVGCATSNAGTPAPAAVASTAAPAPTVTAATPDGLSGTTWRGAATAAPGSESAASVPSITFDSLEHVSGTTGCNRFSGRVVFDGERVRIGPLATTRRGCAASLMEQEKTFLGALEAARAWRRTGGKDAGTDADAALELRDDSGAVVLRLLPASGGAPAHQALDARTRGGDRRPRSSR